MADHATTIEVASTADAVVLTVSGELDAASADCFGEAAYRHVGTGKQLVVDLGATSFMDSSGLKVLATVAVARAGAGGVLVRNPCTQVRKLLYMAGMTQVVSVEPEQAAEPAVRIAS